MSIHKNILQDTAQARLAYKISEVADLIGVNPVSVRRLIRRGVLKASKSLRHPLIRREEILRFLKETE